jgi:hypothetical protein
MKPNLSVQTVQPSATISPNFMGVFSEFWDDGNWDDGRSWDESITLSSPTLNVLPGPAPHLSL